MSLIPHKKTLRQRWEIDKHTQGVWDTECVTDNNKYVLRLYHVDTTYNKDHAGGEEEVGTFAETGESLSRNLQDTQNEIIVKLTKALDDQRNVSTRSRAPRTVHGELHQHGNKSPHLARSFPPPLVETRIV